MTPYARKFVTHEEFGIFERIRELVNILPDIDLGKNEDGEEIILSCHMLVRAVAKIFHLKVIDGYFAKSYDHSWLVTPRGHLIDVYPVATLGGPTLMDGQWLSPSRRLYERTSSRKLSRGRFGKNSFRRSVRRITRALTDIVEIQATL
jgi:hypothetical protein